MKINRDFNGENLTPDRVSDDMVPQYHLKNHAILNVIEHADPKRTTETASASLTFI